LNLPLLENSNLFRISILGFRISTVPVAFMQNKPNLPNTQINTTSALTKDYRNESLRRHPQNKPKQTQFKPNTNPFLPPKTTIKAKTNPIPPFTSNLFTYLLLTSLSLRRPALESLSRRSSFKSVSRPPVMSRRVGALAFESLICLSCGSGRQEPKMHPIFRQYYMVLY
jgi:hypothetical protein